MESSGEGKQIDVGVCTKAMQQLETTLGTVAITGLAEGAPVAGAAKQLISNLNVKA